MIAKLYTSSRGRIVEAAMRPLWVLWQLVIVVAWGAVLIAAVIAVWYAFSFLVLIVVGRVFPLRGWKPLDGQGRDGPGPASLDESTSSPPPKR